MKKKPLIVLLVFIISLLFCLTTLFFRKTSEPVTIGYLGSLSGKYAPMGVSARDGAILAVDHINAQGGINGRPVVLRIMDDEGIPGKAVEQVQTLAGEGIQFLVGPFLSASGVAVLPAVNRYGILTLSPTTSGEGLMDRDDYYFNISPASRQFGQSISKRVRELKLRKVAIISDERNEAFCSPFETGFKVGLENDPVLIEEITLGSNGDGVLGETARRATAQLPDGAVLCTSGVDSAILTQHLKKDDPGMKIFSSAWGMSAELIRNGGSAVDGMELFSAVNLMDKTDRFVEFKGNFRERFSRDASMVSILNYETMMALVKALEESPDITPSAVKSVILGWRGYEGLQQRITFNRNGDSQRKLFLHVVESGLFVPQNSLK